MVMGTLINSLSRGRSSRPGASRGKGAGIIPKTPEQLEKMREAGRVVHRVLSRCREMCQPGVTLRQIDAEAQRLIDEAGAVGLFKGYPAHEAGVPDFPSTLCYAVNDTVVHGVADDRQIEDGDIVGVDCGVRLNGWCGDSATTILVGNVRPKVRRLCEDTEHVLWIAIENVKVGRRWSEIARLMQGYAEAHGYGVVQEFVGHGVGQEMHEDPKVPNFVNRDVRRNDFVLEEGMVLAIEPMCNLGTRQVRTLDDGWTVVTADRQPAAHYEHTVAVTAHGADVLTDGR